MFNEHMRAREGLIQVARGCAIAGFMWLVAEGVSDQPGATGPALPPSLSTRTVRAQDAVEPASRAFLPAVLNAAALGETLNWRFIERRRFNDIAVNEQTGFVWASSNDGVFGHAADAWAMEPFAVIGGEPTRRMGATAVDAAGNTWFAPLPMYSEADAASRSGVVRLAPDGTQRRFTTLDGLAHDAVYAIAADDDGSVWFGTYRGASRLASDGTWSTYRFGSDEVGCGFSCFDVVLSIAPDGLGGVWLGRSTGLTSVSIDGQRGHHSAGAAIHALAVDSSGHAWHAVGNLRVTRRAFADHASDVDARLPVRYASTINDVAIDAADRLWVATDRGAVRIGADGVWVVIRGTEDERTTAIAFEDDGSAWLGLAGRLMNTSESGGIDSSTEHGPPLASDDVTAIALAGDGAVWMGFAQPLGVNAHGAVRRLDPDGTWTAHALSVAVDRVARVRGIAAAPGGRAWASTGGFLGRMGPAEGDLKEWPASMFLADSFIGPPTLADDGTVWFGLPNNDTPTGGAVALAVDGTWQRYGVAEGLSSEDVHAIAVDAARDQVWAVGEGLSVREPGGTWRSVDAPEVRGRYFEAGLVDRAGRRWFAGDDVVVMLDEAGSWHVEPFEGSVSWLGSSSLVEDAAGRLWLGSERNLLRRELDGTWRIVPIPAGATPSEALGWNHVNGLAALPNGELWVATRRGVAILHIDG